jgi:hypothetical protein
VLYPALLDDLDAPRLRAYPVYTVIAEKFEAMVQLGTANSRMKDFFDLAVIARTTALEGATLLQAVRATFARRGTLIPMTVPVALASEFATNTAKTRQWQAFLSKGRLPDQSLADVVSVLHGLLWPPIHAITRSDAFTLKWHPQPQEWR